MLAFHFSKATPRQWTRGHHQCECCSRHRNGGGSCPKTRQIWDSVQANWSKFLRPPQEVQNAITSTAHPPEPTVEPKVELLLWLRKIDIAEVCWSAIKCHQFSSSGWKEHGPKWTFFCMRWRCYRYHKHNSAELQKQQMASMADLALSKSIRFCCSFALPGDPWVSNQHIPIPMVPGSLGDVLPQQLGLFDTAWALHVRGLPGILGRLATGYGRTVLSWIKAWNKAKLRVDVHQF